MSITESFDELRMGRKQVNIPTLYMAEEVIEDTINRFDRVAVACSFGKDSMVVSDLARKIDPDVQHVFYNTGVAFPETIAYKDEMIAKYDINLIELHPYKGMTFWKCLEKYGIPGRRTRKVGKPHSPRCCHYLKEKPMKVFIKEKRIQAVITGLTAAESWNRFRLAYRYAKSKVIRDGLPYCSQRYFATSWDSWQVHPIMTWVEADVWEYLNFNKIPANPVYSKWDGIYDRCGCLPCTAYLSWEKKLSVSHPKLYKFMKEKEIELKDVTK